MISYYTTYMHVAYLGIQMPVVMNVVVGGNEQLGGIVTIRVV